MESFSYGRLIKRWWWTLLLATWIAGLAGYTVASSLPPTYETQVRLLVGPLNADLNTQRAAGQNAQTYAELATSQQLLDAVAQDIGAVTTAQLREAVQARADSTTRLLTLTARGADPDAAVEIANTLAGRIAALPEPAGEELPGGEITIVDPAVRPGAPVAPDIPLIVVLAAVAGLIGAAAIVILIEYVADVVRDRYDLTGVSPVLAIVPSFRSRSFVDLMTRVANLSHHPGVANALRYVTTMLSAPDGTFPRRLLIVGTRAGDGAGALTASVAMVLAEGGRTVTLIDGNGHEREISDLMDVEARQSGTREPVPIGRTRSVMPVEHRLPGLTVLPFGTSELIVETPDASSLSGLLDELVGDTDVVLVNAPPPDRSPAAMTWARAMDATIVVVHADYVTRRQVSSLVDDLDRAGARSVGIVMCQGKPRPGRAGRRSRPAAQATTARSGRLSTLIKRLGSAGMSGRRARRRGQS